jgi:subtilisin family serine protease
MKREKYIFATLLIPFFLFSFNLKLTRLDRDDKTASSLRIKEQQYLAGENLRFPKSKKSVPERTSVEQSLPLVKKEKGVAAESPPPKILRKIRPENLSLSKIERKRKKDSFSYQDRINNFNEGNPFHSSGIQYVPDQVLVKFKPSLSEEMREATVLEYQARKIRRIPMIDIYQLQTPENVSVEEMLYLLEQNPDVEYAVPNHIRHLAITPNDPLFGQQYALYNPGQVVPPGSPQGIERPDIKAAEAWEETRGDEDVIIAILDTGVDFDHPDLDDKLLLNGYDFVNDDSDPTDDNGHGTLVAGIAAAETNNGEGIAGVAWNCKILPIKIADDTGLVDVATEILGIERAVQDGAHVINLSIAGPGYSQPEGDAIRNAYNNGVVVVAAAGNAGGGTEYPAAHVECMAVAATDSDDLRTSWSNYGPEIDVAAPGEGIVGPVPTWFWGPGSFPYGSGDGTSLSAPHVAGLAALIISIKGLEEGDVLLDNNDILIVEDVMNIIRYTADDVNYTNYSGRDDFIGFGRINMERALVPIIISSLNKKND